MTGADRLRAIFGVDAMSPTPPPAGDAASPPAGTKAARPTKAARGTARGQGPPPWFVVLRAIIESDRSPAERAVLASMLYRRDGDRGTVIASIGTIAEGAGLHIDATRRIIRRLEAEGACPLVRASVGGRGSVNRWSMRPEAIAAEGDGNPGAEEGDITCKPRRRHAVTPAQTRAVSNTPGDALPAGAVAVAADIPNGTLNPTPDATDEGGEP